MKNKIHPMGHGGERGTGREENTSQELWWRTGGKKIHLGGIVKSGGRKKMVKGNEQGKVAFLQSSESKFVQTRSNKVLSCH